MDRIKSAYEVALDRLQQRKEVPQTEMDRLEYEPVGKAIAAFFLREKNYDLLAELEKYDRHYQVYVYEGMQKTLFSNILPPKDQSTLENNIRALQGIRLIKEDQDAVDVILGQLEKLFSYYEQAFNQTYAQFKQHFAEKLAPSIRSVEQRTGQKFKIDPEKQPGFREEWNKVLGQLNFQYEQVLDEQKERLRNIQ